MRAKLKEENKENRLMPNFLQRLAAGMEIPGSTNLFVQPEDDNSEDWGQFDSDDNDLLLDDDNDFDDDDDDFDDDDFDDDDFDDDDFDDDDDEF